MTNNLFIVRKSDMYLVKSMRERLCNAPMLEDARKRKTGRSSGEGGGGVDHINHNATGINRLSLYLRKAAS